MITRTPRLGRLVLAVIFWWLAGTSGAHAGYSLSSIDFPGADQTGLLGINNAGELVGDYITGGAYHGFLFSGGTYTTIDVPGATPTRPFAINDNGDIVGDTFVPGVGSRGFLLSGGVFTILQFPGADGTAGSATSWNGARRHRSSLPN